MFALVAAPKFHIIILVVCTSSYLLIDYRTVRTARSAPQPEALHLECNRLRLSHLGSDRGVDYSRELERLKINAEERSDVGTQPLPLHIARATNAGSAGHATLHARLDIASNDFFRRGLDTRSVDWTSIRARVLVHSCGEALRLERFGILSPPPRRVIDDFCLRRRREAHGARLFPQASARDERPAPCCASAV